MNYIKFVWRVQNKKNTKLVSLKLNVTIFNDGPQSDKKMENYNILKLEGEDEFLMKNKYLISQKQHKKTILKTYGPFNIQLPKFENIQEQNKFFMSILLEKNFTLISAHWISQIGADVIFFEEKTNH